MKARHLTLALALALLVGCGKSVPGEELTEGTRRFFEAHPEFFAEEDFTAALAEVQGGNSHAAWEFGMVLITFYANGSGGLNEAEADAVRRMAIEWMKRAAEMGSPHAMLELSQDVGHFRYEGPLSEAQKKTLAETGFSRIIRKEEKDSIDAQYLFACYLFGMGVEADPAAALSWYERMLTLQGLPEEVKEIQLERFRKEVQAVQQGSDAPAAE